MPKQNNATINNAWLSSNHRFKRTEEGIYHHQNIGQYNTNKK